MKRKLDRDHRTWDWGKTNKRKFKADKENIQFGILFHSGQFSPEQFCLRPANIAFYLYSTLFSIFFFSTCFSFLKFSAKHVHRFFFGKVRSNQTWENEVDFSAILFLIDFLLKIFVLYFSDIKSFRAEFFDLMT